MGTQRCPAGIQIGLERLDPLRLRGYRIVDDVGRANAVFIEHLLQSPDVFDSTDGGGVSVEPATPIEFFFGSGSDLRARFALTL